MSGCIETPRTPTRSCCCTSSDPKDGEQEAAAAAAAEKAARLGRDKDPIFYAKFVASFPKLAFGLTLSGHLFLAFLNLILWAAGYDILPVEFLAFPMQLTGELVAQRDYAWQWRNEDPNHIIRMTVDTVGPNWIRGYAIDHVIIYYTRLDGSVTNVFDKDVFTQMRQLEGTVYNLSSYQTSHCQLSLPPEHVNSSCILPTSVLRYFDGSLRHISPIFYDPDFTNIPAVLYEAHTNPQTQQDLMYFLGKGYYITPTEAYSEVTRSSVPVGWPLDLNGSSSDEANLHLVDMFLQNAVKPVLEEGIDKASHGVEVSYYSDLLFAYDVQRQAIKDMMLAIGSLGFIFLFIWIQTRSLWITGFAVLSIITSFWITNLIYRIILDYRYFGYFHVISIFIILGIGADDIFVFSDTWTATGLYTYKSLAHRLSDCYRQAAASMFFTSFTTLVAFMIGGFSPLLPLGSFGVFTAVLVGVNYISVIVFFPCVIITHHLYFTDACCPCCCGPGSSSSSSSGSSGDGQRSCSCCAGHRVGDSEVSGLEQQSHGSDVADVIGSNYAPVNGQKTVSGQTNVAMELEDHVTHRHSEKLWETQATVLATEERAMNQAALDKSHEDLAFYNKDAKNNLDYGPQFDACAPTACSPFGGATLSADKQRRRSKTEEEEEEEEEEVVKRAGCVVVFFRDYYFRFITQPIIRWIIIAVFLAAVGFFTYWATKLEPDAEAIKIYRKEVNYGKAMRLEGSAFIPSGEEFVIIYIVWGMKPRDFSGCHKTNYTCKGVQVWDEVFDPTNDPVQLALQSFCWKLKFGLTDEQLGKLMIRNNSLTGQLQVDCFIDNMHTHLKNLEDVGNITENLDFPLTQTNMQAVMDTFTNIYQPEHLPTAFYRYFEIGVSSWLSAGYTMHATDDYLTYNDLIGENFDGNNTQPVKYHFQMYNQTLSYYGTMLRYAAVRVNLSLSTQELNYIKGFPVMDNWEQFIDAETAQMPVQLQGGYQTTVDVWHILKIQETLVYNALIGIVIGISIAMPVLIIATMNIIVGLIATTVIVFITVSVLGVLPLAGWKLDVMVSMNLSLLVGLSVDYVVHLAEAFHRSHHTNRRGRSRDMLTHLGVSVLSGAATTCGAAFFMLFAQLQFFLQFGTCLFATIGFSLVFSLGLFATVLALFGPENETGSLWPALRWIHRKVVGRQRTDVDCVECRGKGFVPLNVGLAPDSPAALDSVDTDSSESSGNGEEELTDKQDSESGGRTSLNCGITSRNRINTAVVTEDHTQSSQF